MIFGNSELRVQAMTNKVFSNFAITNCFYDPKGKKTDYLLGGAPNARELDADSYEFYRLEIS